MNALAEDSGTHHSQSRSQTRRTASQVRSRLNARPVLISVRASPILSDVRAQADFPRCPMARPVFPANTSAALTPPAPSDVTDKSRYIVAPRYYAGLGPSWQKSADSPCPCKTFCINLLANQSAPEAPWHTIRYSRSAASTERKNGVYLKLISSSEDERAGTSRSRGGNHCRSIGQQGPRN